ncbi:hypothetical protein ACQCRK_19830, partial [Ralstonia pseudosolanacearum]
MGLLDGIGAFVSMVLQACQVNPETREVLAAVERAGENQSPDRPIPDVTGEDATHRVPWHPP